ncbi:MAG TPA: VWA domain-containing protein [Planctomycetota bacterium]|nr:VWA domain-containing protein [Planctomycetota bacterium]
MNEKPSNFHDFRLPLMLSVGAHLLLALLMPVSAGVRVRTPERPVVHRFNLLEVQEVSHEIIEPMEMQQEASADPTELTRAFSDIVYDRNLDDALLPVKPGAPREAPIVSDMAAGRPDGDLNVAGRGLSDRLISDAAKLGEAGRMKLPTATAKKLKTIPREFEFDSSLAQSGSEQLSSPDGLGFAPAPIGAGRTATGSPEPSTTNREPPAVTKPDFELDKRPLWPGSALPSGKSENTADLGIAAAVFSAEDEPERYLRLMLTAQESRTLKPMPKDVLFAIDVSLSMSDRKISEARQAAAQYLPELSPNDRFNVAVFSEAIYRAFPDFVPATPENIAGGVAFIKKVPTEFRTDVYGAIQSICSSLPETNRPCNIFLISDGKSTRGVLEAKRILTDVAAVLRPNVSIFTFDSGGGGNRYLLDLLAWVSRGQSVVVPQTDGASQALVRLAKMHDKPLLTSLKAVYANLDPEETYPRNPTCLYKDQPIVIHSRCSNESNIALHIVGLGDGGLRSYFHNVTLPASDARNLNIAQGWARGKIHHLMAKMARGSDDPAIVKQIEGLGRKYAVPTPYTD